MTDIRTRVRPPPRVRGTPQNLSPEDRVSGTHASAIVRRERADAFARCTTAQMIEAYHDVGKSFRIIAKFLNNGGVPTERGGRWNARQVSRVLARRKTLEGS